MRSLFNQISELLKDADLSENYFSTGIIENNVYSFSLKCYDFGDDDKMLEIYLIVKNEQNIKAIACEGSIKGNTVTFRNFGSPIDTVKYCYFEILLIQFFRIAVTFKKKYFTVLLQDKPKFTTIRKTLQEAENIEGIERALITNMVLQYKVDISKFTNFA